MDITRDIVQSIQKSVQRDRLLQTAVQLIEVPSPTRSAAAVADRLQGILESDGFEVERPDAGWPDAPAVVARWGGTTGGRTLQFNGHLDTVHLPFVPPRIENDVLYGSGASDMKGGIAAMIEAVRALRDVEALTTGAVLLTAHELHELPWGDGSQVDTLIDQGFLGDGVLLPEYLCDQLPVVGRGLAVIEVSVTRPGEPLHEMLGGIEEPSVITAGAEVVRRFSLLDKHLSLRTHPFAGRESIFVGQVSSGEIYNQAPVEFKLSGTRRWLSGTTAEEVERQFRGVLEEVAEETETQIEGIFHRGRDAFEIDQQSPLVEAFQSSYQAVTGGRLPIGAKPFVDDGNTFVSRGGIPAITHGPNAKGAHTIHEEVPVDELVRVATVYALTAIEFCAD